MIRGRVPSSHLELCSFDLTQPKITLCIPTLNVQTTNTSIHQLRNFDTDATSVNQSSCHIWESPRAMRLRFKVAYSVPKLLQDEARNLEFLEFDVTLMATPSGKSSGLFNADNLIA